MHIYTQVLEQKKETNCESKKKRKEETISKWIRKLILNTPPQVGVYRSNVLCMYLILMHQAYYVLNPMGGFGIVGKVAGIEYMTS